MKKPLQPARDSRLIDRVVYLEEMVEYLMTQIGQVETVPLGSKPAYDTEEDEDDELPPKSKPAKAPPQEFVIAIEHPADRRMYWLETKEKDTIHGGWVRSERDATRFEEDEAEDATRYILNRQTETKKKGNTVRIPPGYGKPFLVNVTEQP